MEKIKQLRKKIDEIDSALLRLLHQRIRIASQIKHYKTSNHMDIFSPEREAKIIKALMDKNHAAYPEKSLLKIYNEIFSVSRKVQKPLSIGYLGPEATFTQQAAENIFGSQARYYPLNSIKSIFSELDNEQIDFGVVPIENTTEGIVGYTLDMLIEYNHYIIHESYLTIAQNIISKEKKLNQVKYLYTFPPALAQCRTFVENSLKDVKIIETFSTAQAAKMCSVHKASAAIASRNAAEKYHLNILAERINDNINNYTRFFVISKTPNSIKENIQYKTSIIIGLKDKPGALFSVIAPFNKYKINMTKIESRPTKKKAWEYMFFIEFNGSMKQKNVRKAFQQIENLSTYLRILGSYPINQFTL